MVRCVRGGDKGRSINRGDLIGLFTPFTDTFLSQPHDYTTLHCNSDNSKELAISSGRVDT